MTGPPPTSPRSLSLRTLLAVITAAPVVVAVTLTGWLSVRNGERLVQGLILDLQQEVAAGAERRLLQTLSPPHLLNGLNADLLTAGHLNVADHGELQRHFLGQLQRFDSAGYVQLGLPSGAFVGVERVEDGFRVERTDPLIRGKKVWNLDERGARLGDPIDSVPGYNAAKRPWFRAAVDAGEPTWSSIYQFSSREDVRLGITAVQPWHSESGELLGVLGTDIVLAQLGELLASSRTRQGGRVFAVERDGTLVGHSHVHPPFEVSVDRKATRLTAHSAPDPLTQAVATALRDRSADVTEPLTLTLPFGADLAHALVTPIRDGRGIDWLLVVALPHADFTPELRQNAQQTAVLCVVAALLSLIAGLWASSRVSKPILQLAAASRDLAAGQRSELPRSHTREIAELSRAFATMRDELEQQRAALAETTREALQSKAEAERASTAKSTFLANMSHELRTPMNAILGYTEILAESQHVAPQDLEDLQRIRTAGNRLLALISDVLDLSRIEAGKLSVTLAKHDVNALVGEAVSATRVVVERSGNTLSLQPASESAWVTTDGQKVQQCVVNLLSNAAKFTEHGEITVTVVALPNAVHVEVADTGRGIPANRLDSLFAPFSQVNSAADQVEGTGLGLAITREFCRALGGDVTVESTPGTGSVFRLVLPREARS